MFDLEESTGNALIWNKMNTKIHQPFAVITNL